MKKSFAFKLFAGYTAVIFLLSFFIGLATYAAVKKGYSATLKESLRKICVVTADFVFDKLSEKDHIALQESIKKIGNEAKVRLSVILPSGIVIADSEKDPNLMENHKDRIEFVQALNGRTGYSSRFSASIKNEMMYVALPVYGKGDVLAVVRASMFMEESDKLLKDLLSKITLAGLLLLILSAIIVYKITYKLSAPLVQLKDAASRIASGDFGARTVFKSNDDLRDISESFNYMAERLGELFDRSNYQREELGKIITNIKEGLAVIDGSDRIIMSNESFGAIAGIEKADQRYYWEVLRGSELLDFIKRVKQEKTNISGEFEISGKIYLCSASNIGWNGNIVLLFFDISELKKLEVIKKVFVSNVSHELRTPLTAIKGFAETIEEDIKNPENMKYIEIIKRHTERLINIAGDLLTLSELEGAGYSLDISEVNLNDIIATVIRMFEKKAKDKNLTLNTLLPADEAVVIKGDHYRLEQMLINIVENAVKYTEEGSVKIQLKSNGSKVHVAVSDTGAGIPQEHIERIFERFYVVDKSRSRKMGGTGLGLSIVKHIVNLHNGSIEVVSEVNKGTTFIITLPK